LSPLVKHSIRFILFILVQALVLNHVPPLHRFITPYLYFLYILWLPFNISRWWLLIISFAFGLTLDAFTGTYGLHAAPCLLIGFLRPFMVNLLIPQQGAEQNYTSPSIRSMGWIPYSIFVFFLTVAHHVYLVFIEWMNFGTFWYFLGKVIATTLVSMLLILITEMLFVRKERFKTNT
jgi:hypothetical protein